MITQFTKGVRSWLSGSTIKMTHVSTVSPASSFQGSQRDQLDVAATVLQYVDLILLQLNQLVHYTFTCMRLWQAAYAVRVSAVSYIACCLGKSPRKCVLSRMSIGNGRSPSLTTPCTSAGSSDCSCRPLSHPKTGHPTNLCFCHVRCCNSTMQA